MNAINIKFPEQAQKYIELQCNNNFKLYTSFPELKNTDEIFSSVTPKKVVDIGSGIGRASVFLKNYYSWNETEFHFIDGNEGDVQLYGVRSKENEFYNSFDVAKFFCNANNLTRLTLWDAREKKWVTDLHEVDLIYSFLAIGFHWPLEMYLNDIYKISLAGTYVIFGVRGVEEEKWVKDQVSKIDKDKYKILKFIIKPTSSRESILILQRI